MAKQPQTAREALERFVLLMAPKHHPSDNAPETWKELSAWADTHTLGVDSLPVRRGDSENTIYSTPQGNWAFRAWHDALHIRHGLTVSADDELRAALLHQHALTDQLGLFELEAKRILWADTAGQTAYFQHHGSFPAHQLNFVRAYLENPGRAILDTH